MTDKRLRCALIADFTAQNLAACFRNSDESPAMEILTAPPGPAVQILADAGNELWQQNPDVGLVWSRPEAVSPSYAKLLDYEKVSLRNCLDETDAFCNLLKDAALRVKYLFVPSWVAAPRAVFGALEMKPGHGTAHALLAMNQHLAENLAGASNICVLNMASWAADRHSMDPRLWYMAKIPFSADVFRRAVAVVKAVLRGWSGKSRKLILVDLDDTLWGGLVGEEGWESLRIGGHDPLGEAFADFQALLKAMTRRGILLGIVSKNEESVALEALQRHPEMRLRPEDFAGWRINWGDKAENVKELTRELNFGLDAVVYIDESVVERSRVAEALPEVYVPEWPDDPMLYKQAFMKLDCFNQPYLSAEDAARAEAYAAEHRRNEIKKNTISLSEWLKSLGMEVRAERLSESNLPRTAQLLNKTNQMNLAARRMTEDEIRNWSNRPDRLFMTFRVSDRFGSSGLTGLLSLEKNGQAARIVDFVLSCRVMGRKVEETMLHTAFRQAESWGVEELKAEYIPTPRNAPCFEFFKNSGLTEKAGQKVFFRPVRESYPLPPEVSLVVEGEIR